MNSELMALRACTVSNKHFFCILLYFVFATTFNVSNDLLFVIWQRKTMYHPASQKCTKISITFGMARNAINYTLFFTNYWFSFREFILYLRLYIISLKLIYFLLFSVYNLSAIHMLPPLHAIMNEKKNRPKENLIKITFFNCLHKIFLASSCAIFYTLGFGSET